jgi:ABC-type sugar transport system substrate-binding protein
VNNSKPIKETKGKAILKQIVSANWDTNIAMQKFIGLKKRYPKANVVWTASDGMGIIIFFKL